MKSSRDPDEFALRSLRIRGVTTLPTRGGKSDRMIRREGRRRPNAYKAYTHNIIEDSTRVPCKVVVASERKGLTTRPRFDQGRK